MKKIIFLICFFSSFICRVKAECTYSEISRLKGYASNINISYDYRIENDNVYFKTTLNNLTPELYIIDNYTNIRYSYEDSNNGELIIDNYENFSGDKYNIYANTSGCHGKKLLSKYYSFPRYNIYYNSNECEGIQNYYLCRKWVSQGTSFNHFYEDVEKYKNSKEIINEENENENVIIYESLLDAFFDFYANNYYYILTPIIALALFIIIYQNKQDKFKL